MTLHAWRGQWNRRGMEEALSWAKVQPDFKDYCDAETRSEMITARVRLLHKFQETGPHNFTKRDMYHAILDYTCGEYREVS